MKHIGLVGGMSPESTIDYYKKICSDYNKIAGNSNFPQMTIRSINLQEIVDCFPDNDWHRVAMITVDAIYALERAGADFAAISTNTVHNAIDEIKYYSPLEVLSITDATAEAILKDNMSCVGLLGTKPTMEYGFFQKTFENYGIETVIPNEVNRKYINDVIFNQLVHGEINEDSRKNFVGIIDGMRKAGAEGVILGCTEIPLLVKNSDSPIKTYDTADIHADAILKYALKD